jgi:hypothetical protein
MVVFVQPKPKEYVISDVPGDVPHTKPLVPIVATAVLLLVHVPPVAVSDSVVQLPKHTWVLPVMIDGAVFTVTTVVAVQPAVVV